MAVTPRIQYAAALRLYCRCLWNTGSPALAGDNVMSPGASSPCVPVAIRKDAVTRIATVSAAATSTTGVFIVTRSRYRSPRVVVKELQMAWRKNFLLCRERHRHRHLDREHRKGDDQAQRQ